MTGAALLCPRMHRPLVSPDAPPSCAHSCTALLCPLAPPQLCTIASTSRLLREWEEVVGGEEPLELHTAIIDECGCTAESSVAL